MAETLSLFDRFPEPASAKPVVTHESTEPTPVAAPAPAPYPDADSLLPPGYRWLAPPSVMVGEFKGYLQGGEANIYYVDNGPRGGWGRIERHDFARGELERLEPGCHVERWCGDAEGPELRGFMVRARVVR